MRVLIKHIDEKVFYEELFGFDLIGEGFFNILEQTILASQGWFSSYLSRKGKLTLLKELIGDSEIVKEKTHICEHCGSDDIDLKDNEKISLICKTCGKELNKLNLIEKGY